jgi:ribosome-associated heat shock protein Hsp15
LNNSELRIDKWLWSVRVFKTRSQATEACKKGRIIIDNVQVKASRIIKLNETIVVRKLPVIYTFKVLGFPKSRVGAKLVSEYLEDLTSVEELDKLKLNDHILFYRERGTGRPTKKDRRDIDRLKNFEE